MAGIEKSIELYEMIIERLRDSGLAPNQLKYYEECLNLIRSCATAEEAELAMRNSPLYNQGGQALMLDKFIAYMKAMEYCGYEEAERVYRDKYNEIKDNYASAWDTSYMERITGILTEYEERKSLFTEVAFGPVNYLGASELPTDEGGRKMDDDKLKDAYVKLSSKGLDFFEMAREPIYRELVPLDDEMYAIYINNLKDILGKGTMAENEDQIEYARIKEFAETHKDDLRAAREKVRVEKAVFLAVPNEEATCKYDFIEKAEEV